MPTTNMATDLGFDAPRQWIAYDRTHVIWGCGTTFSEALEEGYGHAVAWATGESRKPPVLLATKAYELLTEALCDFAGGEIDWGIDGDGVATLAGDHGRATFRDHVLFHVRFGLERGEFESPADFAAFAADWLRQWPEVEDRYVLKSGF